MPLNKGVFTISLVNMGIAQGDSSCKSIKKGWNGIFFHLLTQVMICGSNVKNCKIEAPFFVRIPYDRTKPDDLRKDQSNATATESFHK